LCESHAVSEKQFSVSELKLLRAALSDICAAKHIGEVLGLTYEETDGEVSIGCKGYLKLKPGLILNCTLQSTLSKPEKSLVAKETIRRLRVDHIGSKK